jgi:signal transduction histidine kinase
VFENYDYSESFIHKAIPYLMKWSFYTLIGRFVYLRLKEVLIRKERNKQKLNEIRTKIAYEMHQDIGNDLNALVYKIKNWHAKNGHVNSEEFKQLENTTVQVIVKVNDIVWSLNSEKNNLKELQIYLVNYAEQTLANAHLACTINAVSNMPTSNIELEVKKNIYLLFKEAINNVVKHAQASQVQIQFKYHLRKLQISIADNGKGFDADLIIKGNGLDSMHHRIKQLNGKIEIIQNQPKGTIVKFELKV